MTLTNSSVDHNKAKLGPGGGVDKDGGSDPASVSLGNAHASFATKQRRTAAA